MKQLASSTAAPFRWRNAADRLTTARRGAAGRIGTFVASPAAAWVMAGVLAVAALYEIQLAGGEPFGPAGAAALVATVPFARLRRHPVVVAYLAIIGSAVSFQLLQRLLVASALACLTGFYLLARHGTARARWLRVAGGVAVLAWPLGGWSDHAGFAALGVTFAVVTAVAVGDASRSRSEMRRERQAAMTRMIAAERQRAIMAERARIARELHDVVAHSVSVIAVQAELTPHAIPSLSPDAREGFQQIAHSARATMAELRQLLDVLRRDGPVIADLSPQPTLDEVEELVRQHRETGGDVEFRIHGERRPLAASVELSAYRIVQEALTNVRRHAPGAAVQVGIGYQADRLVIRVANDGPGLGERAKDETSAGHGLVGMRERAAMLGGRLSAGPVPHGGFVVAADLPLTAQGAARQ